MMEIAWPQGCRPKFRVAAVYSNTERFHVEAGQSFQYRYMHSMFGVSFDGFVDVGCDCVFEVNDGHTFVSSSLIPGSNLHRQNI